MRKVLSFAAACCVLAAIAFVTVAPIEWRPDDIFGVNVDRAMAFAILGGLFTAAYPRRWGLVVCGVAIIASGLEIVQLLSDSRHARMEDAAVKIGGAVAGILLALTIRQVWFFVEGRLAAPAQGMREFRLQPSSSISAVYFNPSDGMLRLRFADGEERLFAGVHEGEVVGLLHSQTPAAYVEKRIEPNYERRAA